jgi:type II secretory pathway predicted ATPase ExeA
MGTQYYGLSGNPFEKEYNFNGSYYQSRDFKEAIARLYHLKDIRGMGVFTARPGMGKSLALKCFADSLNQNLYRTEYISFSTVTVPEFYRQLCETLGISDIVGKTARVRAIKEQLSFAYTEKKQTMILILDEAQYLNTGILNDLKMLMNFKYDTVNCFALVLCGEPFLNTTLNKQIHAALRQRVTVHYEFKGLQGDEVKDYILFKIRAAGGADSIIDEAALSAIAGYAQGNPRIIDSLMNDALKIGEQQKLKSINSDVIMAAAENRVF